MAKIDLSGFHAKLRLMESVGHDAEAAAVRSLAGFFAETVADLTPKDTNRAANGWVQAGRSVGVTQRAMLPYQPSVRREKFLQKMQVEMDGLAERIRRDESMMERYRQEDAERAGVPRRDGKPRKRRVNQPYYRVMEKRVRRNRKSLGRLEEEYKKALGSESFIFFDADGIVQRRQGRRFSTVRDKIYGGEGRVVAGPTGISIELKNKEPHVNIIERHPHLGHPITTALGVTRAAGRIVASRKYIEITRRRLRTAG